MSELHREWNMERERETEEVEIICARLHPPDGCKGQNWVGQKSGARGSFQFSHVGTGARYLGHCLMLSQLYQQGTGSEVEQLVHKLVPKWDVGAAGGELGC